MPTRLVPAICSWCQAERAAQGLPPKVLGTKEVEVPEGQDYRATHGICPECAAKERAAISKARKEEPWPKQ